MGEYEALLRSLTYTNLADEPVPGNRYINITISDGVHQDITAVIIIVVLVNDNVLTIQVNTPGLVFTEGDTEVLVGQQSGLQLVDMDRNPMITSLMVRLVGALDTASETLVIDLAGVTGGTAQGLEIVVNQTDTLEDYQVSLQQHEFHAHLQSLLDSVISSC